MSGAMTQEIDKIRGALDTLNMITNHDAPMPFNDKEWLKILNARDDLQAAHARYTQKELSGDFQTTRLIAAHALIKEGRGDEALPMIETAIKCASEQSSGESEPVAWQFYDDGKWYMGMDTNNHKENTISGGYPVRDLYAKPVGYAGGGEAVPDGYVMVPVSATRGIEDAIASARHLQASEIWEDAITVASKEMKRPVLALPEGYVMVPVEPTKEMLVAASDYNDYATSGGGTPDEFNIMIYKAMIAASKEGK